MKWVDDKFTEFAKIPENNFLSVFVVDSTLLVFFIIAIYHIGLFYINRKTTELIIFSFLAIVFIIACFAFFKMIKEAFELLPYTYKIARLFRKYIFLYEALIFASLTFLLGINSSLFSLFEIKNKLLNFSVNASLVIASCLATSTKAMLDYASASWDLEHRRKGDELVDDETEKAKS